MSDEYKKHYSVLNREVISFFSEALDGDEAPLFADLTFGAGGHCFSIIDSISNSRVLATDQDIEAYNNGNSEIGKRNLKARVSLVHTNFNDFDTHQLFRECKGELTGIVLDLGVSSHHFDKPERGFSFRFDAQLDMRMDTVNNSLTAKEIVNEYSRDDLEMIFRDYGEERFARRIAQQIVDCRSGTTIEKTGQLEDLCFHAYPKASRFRGPHPATRVFQALRIAVNRELDVLSEVIPRLIDFLKPGGRLAIISFHSLEDRIVKKMFKSFPKDEVKILTKKPIIPSHEEIVENNRSRSAKLRVLEKIER